MKVSKTAVVKSLNNLNADQLKQLYSILNPANPATERVNITYRITQLSGSKTTFMFEHKCSAPASAANVQTLAKKTAYVLADYLVKLCKEAQANRDIYGRYITSFRPSAAFQIEIIVDNTVKFVNLSTKGQDAIRLMKRTKDSDGERVNAPIERGLITDKLLLLATLAEINSAMADSLSFAENTLESLQIEA